MTGIVKTYDPKEFIGTIEDAEGKLHLSEAQQHAAGHPLARGLRGSVGQSDSLTRFWYCLMQSPRQMRVHD
jgi:hypothetical protein